MSKPSFWGELKRRHVFRVAIAYAVTAWLLLQLGAIIFPTLHAPAWCEAVLLAFLVLGLPVALLLAWAFEVTPEGVRRTGSAELAESEAAPPAGYRRHVGRVLNVGIIVVLAAAVGILLWRQLGASSKSQVAQVAVSTTHVTSVHAASPATVIPAKSIAVLPFENLSTDQNNKYFAGGMQDMILTKLAEIGGLTVIARTSTLGLASHPRNLQAIARELGVANILEGSVQKAGDQVLIDVQLIDARNAHHLWARSYQRTLQNIFGVEGEVAEKVAAALKAKLDPAERARIASVPTQSPAAYDAYLRGSSIETSTNDIHGITLEKAASHYEQAVKLDPGFALAWAHLSAVDSDISFTNYDSARLARAKSALERAVALAPDAAETQIAKGNYAYYGQLDYVKALAAYRRALQISPNSAVALLNIGFVERRQGHWQAAIDSMNRSLALDPRNVNTLSNLALSYWSLRRDAKAKQLLQRALAISPNDPNVESQLASVYQSQGELVQAGHVLAGARISPSYWEGSYQTVIGQAVLTRRYGDAVRLLQKALANPNLPPQAKVGYYAALGTVEQFAGNRQAAHRAYQQVLTILKPPHPSAGAPQQPQSPRIANAWAGAALTLAGLGKKDAALNAIRHAIALLPASRDAFGGPTIELVLARVQIRLGNKAQAIAVLKHLLALPPGSAVAQELTPALLRLAPSWDPLRRDPAFQALLKKYAKYKPATVPTVGSAPTAATAPAS